MRSPKSIDEQALYLVCEEAEKRRWPMMTLDFHGTGYKTSWGPGVNPWINVLWQTDGDDLKLILNALRQMQVPILRGVEDVGEALSIAIERSARFWAELRATLPVGDRTTAYDAVMSAGAHLLVEQILVQFSLVPVMANAWQQEYRRQVANVNAEREQAADAAKGS